MPRSAFPQFESEYDVYKMRALVDELERQFNSIQQGGEASGGGLVTVHNDLTGRSAADAHPTSAITGLIASLDALANAIGINAAAISANVADIIVNVAAIAANETAISVNEAAITVNAAAIVVNAAAIAANALALANINHQEEFFEGMSTRFLIHTDFTDPVGAKVTPNLHAVTAGAGAIIAGSISDPTDHPGIWRMLTGTTVAGRVFVLSIAGGTLVGTVRVGSGRLRVGTWLMTSANLSTVLERYTIRSGLFAINLPNIIDEGIGFEYDDSQNGGRWQAICDDAPGVETSVDTGVTVTASTWYKLEFEVNAAGTSVDFLIDNVVVATIVTNIPSGSPFDLFYNTHILKIIGVTSREMEIDAMYMYQEINRL